MPKAEKKKNKVEVLNISVIIDSTSRYNAVERENFFRGYINNIDGCQVLDTSIEDAEVIKI
tara:strand:+ start:166 stop:348 length:183 start_codon:yes stop_codon:yes gene_type:complete